MNLFGSGKASSSAELCPGKHRFGGGISIFTGEANSTRCHNWPYWMLPEFSYKMYENFERHGKERKYYCTKLPTFSFRE